MVSPLQAHLISSEKSLSQEINFTVSKNLMPNHVAHEHCKLVQYDTKITCCCRVGIDFVLLLIRFTSSAISNITQDDNSLLLTYE